MHSATLFLIMAVMATFALAAPLTSPNGLVKRSFRVTHKGRPKLSGRDALRKAQLKYGWDSSTWSHSSSDVVSGVGDTSDATNSTSGGSGDGEVQATPDSTGGAYISPVNIGGQQLNLDFDTGSSDLWVFSTSLPASQSAGHTLFDPAKSSSFVSLQGASWMAQYGDGSTASGTVGFDSVSIGGATVQKQCVELADTTQGFSTLVQSDGLLGLGFSNINTVKPQQQKTFWENILPQLDQPVFTADLDETASGSYEFGSIDSTKFTGQIQYTPVNSDRGYWMVDSNSYSIGGNVSPCQTCSPAVMDTGTSLLLVDSDVALAYYKQVQGSGFSAADGLFIYPCGTTLPDFGVAIGDHMTTLKGSDLLFTQSNDGKDCVAGVQPSGMTGPTAVQIYGDVFFKQYFTVFDGGNTQVGIAPKA